MPHKVITKPLILGARKNVFLNIPLKQSKSLSKKKLKRFYIFNTPTNKLFIKKKSFKFILCTEYGSEDFEEFLGVLGEKIQLKSWERYRGGLDVKGIYKKNERKVFFYHLHYLQVI